MTQQVQVLGVGMLQFPDGMSQPAMAAAIQRNFPQLGKPQGAASPAASSTAPPAPPTPLADMIPQPAPGPLEDQIPSPAPPAGAQGAAPSAGASASPRLGPWASSFVRPIVQGVSSLPLLAMNAGVATRNLVGDALNRALGRPATPDYTLPGTTFNQILDQYTTAPTSTLGKIGEGLNSMLVGGMLPVPAGLTAADARAASQVPRGFVGAAPRGAPPAAGLTSAQANAAAQGGSLGMRLTPGQATGSVPLQQLEARLSSRPMTSGPFAAIKSANQAVLNRTAAKAIGEDSDVLDADTLARANDRLGQVFDNVRSTARTVMADPASTSQFLDQVDADSSGLLPGNASIRDNPLVKQLETLTQNGHINGQQLGALSSKLGRAAFKAMTGPNGDRDLGQALYQVKDHVDDLVQSTLTPAEGAEYATARQQYRNLMLLTSRTNITNPATGNVSGTALASKLQQADRPGYLFGANQSPLYQASRFAQAFKPLVGDSGTATRSAGHSLVLPLALGLGLGGGAHALGSPEGVEALAALAPLAARPLANLAVRGYLTRPGSMLARGVLAAPKLLGRGLALPLRAVTPRAIPRPLTGSRLLLGPLANPALLALPGQ